MVWGFLAIMPCLLKVISNIRVWNGSLTIACFPASSNLGRSLVCFLLWQCLVISFLCLLGLAFLMKLCSLETPNDYQSLSGIVLDDPQSFQMKFCQFFLSAMVQTRLAHGAPKKLMCLPSATGALWENGNVDTGWLGGLLPADVWGSLPCLCGGKLEEHSPKQLCMATGMCPCRHMAFHQGTSFFQSGVQWCFADFRHPLALHKLTLVGFFLMHQPEKDEGWVQLQHEGFQENQALSLRFCLGIKNNGVCAWGNRLVGFKGIYSVTLSAKWFLCLYEEHVTSWKVAVFLIESRIVYKQKQ